MAEPPQSCQWIPIEDALREFALATRGTQSQRHIRPLHWYIACRLCLEGGFHPDEITPRPPFLVQEKGSRGVPRRLRYDAKAGGCGEQTILGGLKTKQVDVVVTKPGIGPVIAVSVKGTLNAFRNLTNRLEEAGGDCTNLHLTYPSLVYAFWSVLRANRPGPVPRNAPTSLRPCGGKVAPSDIAVDASGKPVSAVVRYHLALSGLTGRDGIRNAVSRYEAVALTLVEAGQSTVGRLFARYPEEASPLHYEGLFPAIYRAYDLRFVYQAPDLEAVTARRGWAEDSCALKTWPHREFTPRLCQDESSPG